MVVLKKCFETHIRVRQFLFNILYRFNYTRFHGTQLTGNVYNSPVMFHVYHVFSDLTLGEIVNFDQRTRTDYA